YYLAPMKGGSKGYALLRETLKRTNKIGVAKVVIRTREYLGAVIARGPLLLLEIMRYAHELRPWDELELPGEDIKELGVSEKEWKSKVATAGRKGAKEVEETAAKSAAPKKKVRKSA